jgi:hypothetical protein
MKTTIKFIQDNFPNIEIFENYTFSYFLETYVITQSGVIKAVLAEFKKVPQNLSEHHKFKFYHSSGKTDGITFYFDKDKIYRNIPGIINIEIEEVPNEEVIFNLFSKEIFQTENVILDEETKKCLIAVSDLQKMAIEKFTPNKSLRSLINILKIRYTDNVILESFEQRISYKRTDNKIGEIRIQFNSEYMRLSFSEVYNEEYINGFTINFDGKNNYVPFDKLMNECNLYKNKFINTEYFFSFFPDLFFV